MEYNALLKLVDNDPIFESSLLMAGNVDPRAVRTQLSRWVSSGRIQQLRRGVYTIAPPYRKIQPHPFLTANYLRRASYVSLQSALAYYDLIPETVFQVTSVTTGRPERLQTPLGEFEYRHISTGLFFGYHMIETESQSILLAWPEKALLDLIYLQPRGESMDFLQGLRLQNMYQLDMDRLEFMVKKFHSTKMTSAVKNLSMIKASSEEGYVSI